MKGELKKDELAFYVNACASFHMRKAARAMTQFFDRVLRPAGLRSTQLVILLAAGLKEEASMSELAEAIVSDRTTLTRALKPLLNRGLVKSLRGKDRRKSAVVLTPRGHQAIRKAAPYWHRAQARVEKGFGERAWKDFTVKLDRTIRIVHGS